MNIVIVNPGCGLSLCLATCMFFRHDDEDSILYQPSQLNLTFKGFESIGSQDVIDTIKHYPSTNYQTGKGEYLHPTTDPTQADLYLFGYNLSLETYDELKDIFSSVTIHGVKNLHDKHNPSPLNSRKFDSIFDFAQVFGTDLDLNPKVMLNLISDTFLNGVLYSGMGVSEELFNTLMSRKKAKRINRTGKIVTHFQNEQCLRVMAKRVQCVFGTYPVVVVETDQYSIPTTINPDVIQCEERYVVFRQSQVNGEYSQGLVVAKSTLPVIGNDPLHREDYTVCSVIYKINKGKLILQ